jgi:hypothetical protein
VTYTRAAARTSRGRHAAMTFRARPAFFSRKELLAAQRRGGRVGCDKQNHSGRSAALSAYLCVPKIRFCNIGDEDRQGQVAI